MPFILRINLSTKEVKKEPIEKGHVLEFYAGRALSSKIVHDEVPPKADPLGPENKLIVASGFLGGTPAPNSGRISIGSKSPLTMGIKESNVGGRAPAMLGYQDIRAIILEQSAASLTLLKIQNGEVEFLDASEYQGINNYEFATKLIEKYGKLVGAFTIGIAGEKMLQAASIASIDMEGYPSRHAGRGGMGAVLGSKKVKGILVMPSKKEITYEDFPAFKLVAKDWFKTLYDTKRVFSDLGTLIGLQTMSEHNGLPTKNFRSGSYEDVEKISGEALHEYLLKNNGKFGVSCSPGCAIRCSNIVYDPAGNHITSSLEYETVALNGSNLLINDLEKLAKIDQLSDDLGIDSIETGNTLAVFMEAGKIEWGDADAVIALLEGMKTGNPESIILGQGCKVAGEKLNVTRIAHVKGQGIPGYDPRTFKGMGATFVTSPMGADHTAGPAIMNRKAYSHKEYGKVHEPNSKLELSKDLQIFITMVDSMGLCYFVGPSWDTTVILAKLLNAKYGWDTTPEFWVTWAEDALKMEVDYNTKIGLPTTERLPAFMEKEAIGDPKREWDIPQADITKFWEQ
jgi:aldehyde:ferredoxin oxidoreductase